MLHMRKEGISRQPEDPNVSVAQEAPNLIPEVSNTHSSPIFEPVETTNNTSGQDESVQEQVIFSTQEDTPVEQMNIWKSANKGWTLHKFDVKNAFLHGDLKEEIYMEAPHGFTNSFGERERGNLITYLIIYVDDMIIMGNDKEEITKLKKNLFTEFEMKDLGRLKYFLRIEVLRLKQGIFMYQKKNDPSNTGPALSTSTPSSYANVTGKPSRKRVNFRTLFTPTSNGIDVVVPVKSIRAISEWFTNTVYGFFLGKLVAYPIVANYVRNTWGKYGLVKSMLNSSTGLFSF
nr:cysteine-rich RLK (receptor-like protein kinase) 8 [Tanacetum cinerariifolium]